MKEVVRLCGINGIEIQQRLSSLQECGVEFDIEEDCLDAVVTMSSDILDARSFDMIKSRVYNLFEEEVYSSVNEPLQVIAAKLLKINGRTLAVAESLTGGEICSRLAEVPGISENLYEGIVCYNRASKMQRLGVSRSVLDQYGAVSRETAYLMVKGLNIEPVDIGLATTGLAGPTGDEGKPVGLVYIGVGGGDFIIVFERHFEGSRDQIRRAASNVALFYLIRYLKGDILRL